MCPTWRSRANDIYVPKGRAREYASLACNLYTGCSHGCRYCYGPGVLRKSRFDFVAKVKPRPGILEALERDAAKLSRPHPSSFSPQPSAGPVHDLSPVVGYWRVGKLNHDKAREEKIDWRAFLAEILRVLGLYNASYYIKQDLWEFADDRIRGQYPQRNGVPEE